MSKSLKNFVTIKVLLSLLLYVFDFVNLILLFCLIYRRTTAITVVRSTSRNCSTYNLFT